MQAPQNVMTHFSRHFLELMSKNSAIVESCCTEKGLSDNVWVVRTSINTTGCHSALNGTSTVNWVLKSGFPFFLTTFKAAPGCTLLRPNFVLGCFWEWRYQGTFFQHLNLNTLYIWCVFRSCPVHWLWILQLQLPGLRHRQPLQRVCRFVEPQRDLSVRVNLKSSNVE